LRGSLSKTIGKKGSPLANDTLNPFQTFYDNAGRELARGTIEFFENGQTVTQLDIFTDSDLSFAQTNPYELDDFGRIRGDVHYKGLATIIKTNAAGLQIGAPIVDVLSSSSGDTGSITKNKASIAAMVTDEALAVGDIVRTQGYYAGNNYGGARYVIVAAATGTANNYLFHNLGNGLQAQLLDLERNKNFLVAGARGDGGTDDTVPMQAVISLGGDVEVEGGFTFVATELAISQNVRFVGSGSMKQDNSAGGDLFQITSTAVTAVQWRGVTLDGNQVNGNDANATVGWVLA
jgi:hypothetical protein